MFQVHTTEDVLAETEYRLRRDHPLMAGGVITDLRKKITATMDEIIEDFDATIPFSGKDPHDRHVHAAAVASQAEILLTDDTGFEGSDDEPYEVFGCDAFFVLIDDSAAWHVQRVVADQLKYWESKPGKTKTLAQALRDAGCPEFALRVEQHVRTLAGPINRSQRRAQTRRSK